MGDGERLPMSAGRYRNFLGAEIEIVELYDPMRCIGGIWHACQNQGVLGRRRYLVTQEGLEQAGYERVEDDDG